MADIIRTDSSNKDFQSLVFLLDADLKERDGEDNLFYAAFNKIDSIKNVVLVYKNRTAVACGAFKPFQEKTVEIKRMFVRKDSRGQGLAQEVLHELEKWATELTYNKCVLETGKRQPEAIRLYEKSGYRRIPNYGQYEHMENSVCMEKDIGVIPIPQILS